MAIYPILSSESASYSPTRHLGAALFPSTCTSKYMLMLTAYMDETGHSKDERQKFNGMAGLITTVEHWYLFEPRWERALKKFDLPYLHMSESALFDGWTDYRKEKCSELLWDLIEDARPFPIASIIPMDDWKALEVPLKKYMVDPYYQAMQDSMKFATLFAGRPHPLSQTSSRVAMVFSDQVEFKYDGMRMFDAALKHWKADIDPNLVDAPTFRDMRKLVPLQAADMVAYEVYKEYDRVYYNRDRDQRYGYKRLEKIVEWGETREFPGLNFLYRHSRESLAEIAAMGERQERMGEYWRKKKTKG